MAVTQVQVAALRAQLVGDVEEHRRLLVGLGDDDRRGYATLLASAFWEAVDRRFGTGQDRATVIEFVGEMRARSETIREQLSAEAAELMILQVLGENTPGELQDLDDETVISAQIMITSILVADEDLDEAGLDAFVETARATAERILG